MESFRHQSMWKLVVKIKICEQGAKKIIIHNTGWNNLCLVFMPNVPNIETGSGHTENILFIN